MDHFVYIWYDKIRKMYYVGKHSGSLNDTYTTSSAWLKGEIRYRPQDFKRRILQICQTENMAQIVEGRLLSKIKPEEFGTKYYNLKIGKPKGTEPWNKGRTFVQPKPKKPKAKWNNAASATNGKKAASKLSAKATGRKRSYNPDGSWTWIYPVLVNKDIRKPQTT